MIEARAAARREKWPKERLLLWLSNPSTVSSGGNLGKLIQMAGTASSPIASSWR